MSGKDSYMGDISYDDMIEFQRASITTLEAQNADLKQKVSDAERWAIGDLRDWNEERQSLTVLRSWLDEWWLDTRRYAEHAAREESPDSTGPKGEGG